VPEWWRGGVGFDRRRADKIKRLIMFLEFAGIIYRTDGISKVSKWEPLKHRSGDFAFGIESSSIMLFDEKDKLIDCEEFENSEERDKRFDEIKQKLGA